MISLGKVVVSKLSKKQSINVNSSTEDDLIGIDDARPK